jgi:methionyl-tRNA formyltransferase
VAFLGNDPWSVPTLRALDDAGDVEVGLVVTNRPKPAGRGSNLTPTPVADEARARGLPLLEVDGVRSGRGFDALAELDPDALVVVAYGEILSAELIDTPRFGSLNMHFSVLPRWRGAAPVQRAILEGDERTGVTVMLMDAGMDTGPILATVEVQIEDGEDAGTLGGRLAELGAPLLVDTLRDLAAGAIEPHPQDQAAATHAPKPTARERVIDWGDPAAAIVRRVRAFAPHPGATTTFRGEPLKVLRVEARPIPRTSAPDRGRLGVRDDDGTPWVDVVSHAVGLLEVAPAGRKRMSGAEWARGARIQPGERLG